MKLQTILLPGRSNFLGLLFVLLVTVSSRAAESATAQVTDTVLGANSYQYTVNLDNDGTLPIGTFWFAWVPGKDFMNSAPSNLVLPSGWTDNITGGGSSDGYAIQFLDSTGLAANGTATFIFDSAVLPSQLAGASPFFSNPSFPEGTSVIYQGTPFTGESETFVATVAPEPSSWGLLAVGSACLAYLGWRRTRVQVLIP